MKDKNGKTLKVGDWVLYPWWDEPRKRYNYFCDTIKMIPTQEDEPNTVYVRGTNKENFASTASRVEKLPKLKSKRNQILMLKKLQSINIFILK